MSDAQKGSYEFAFDVQPLGMFVFPIMAAYAYNWHDVVGYLRGLQAVLISTELVIADLPYTR